MNRTLSDTFFPGSRSCPYFRVGIVLLALLCTPSDLPASQKRSGGGDELFENGGFEDGLNRWTPIDGGSGSTTIDVDSEIKASGKNALKLVRKSPRLFPPDGVEMKLDRQGQQRKLIIEYKVRTDDSARAVVSLVALSSDGVFLVATVDQPITSLRKFRRQKLSLAVPPDTERFVLSLAIQGQGTVWYDDLRLRRK